MTCQPAHLDSAGKARNAGPAKSIDGPDGVKEAEHRPGAIYRIKQSEAWPVTLTMVTIDRFEKDKQVVSCEVLNRSEKSNGGKQELVLIQRQRGVLQQRRVTTID